MVYKANVRHSSSSLFGSRKRNISNIKNTFIEKNVKYFNSVFFSFRNDVMQNVYTSLKIKNGSAILQIKLSFMFSVTGW